MTTNRTWTMTPSFGSEFLEDHAGQLVTSPSVALVELVANAWDAGADLVEIEWPRQPVPEPFRITDNGTGMTAEEFQSRWMELGYNRKAAQGEDVLFPVGNQASHRRAYGRNGKGRHSAFCFTSQYFVETWRDGVENRYSITKPTGRSRTPFAMEMLGEAPKEGHGTSIWGEIARGYLDVDVVRDLIGSKFVSDPSFRIVVNGETVEFTDLSHLQNVQDIDVDGVGTVRLIKVDTRRNMRRSAQHGVAWWVNKRLVGDVSWRGFENHRFMDGRMTMAKRYTFIVEADILIDEVLPDWTGFKPRTPFKRVFDDIAKAITKAIMEAYRNDHKRKKIEVLQPLRASLGELPPDARFRVGQFVDSVQAELPAIHLRDLAAVTQVLVNLEQSRTGTRLLHQLAHLKPADMDELSQMLDAWTVQEVRTIVGELEWRLAVIEELEQLVEDKRADELHDIHPLFERGLWIFGPEYESVSFQSNRTLLTVIRNFLGSELKSPLDNPARRADIIALPDRTLLVQSSDSYDEESSEVNGIAAVLIIELKRGGYTITRKEKQQATDYAYELMKSKRLGPTTKIRAFVLGASIEPDAAPDTKEGDNIVITARPYQTVLRQAHARSFHLLKKIRDIRKDQLVDDPEVKQVLSEDGQSAFWNGG